MKSKNEEETILDMGRTLTVSFMLALTFLITANLNLVLWKFHMAVDNDIN